MKEIFGGKKSKTEDVESLPDYFDEADNKLKIATLNYFDTNNDISEKESYLEDQLIKYLDDDYDTAHLS